MKLHLLNRSSLSDNSFSVCENIYPHFLKIWHYHPELELVVILKSKGTLFVGDCIESFAEGDIVLVGKNLPHMWLNDDEYFLEDSELIAHADAVHFKEDFAGAEFFNMPEMKGINKLVQRAEHGIKFNGDSSSIGERIIKLVSLQGFERVMSLISILNELSNREDYKLLSSVGFINSFKKSGKKDLGKVYEYIINNFKQNISLSDVAEIAYMNPSAFSRFFKRVNRKTFSEYLSEVRVGYACKLLLEDKYNISEVCFESGFNNISNFNRQFKKIMNFSPTEYLKAHNI